MRGESLDNIIFSRRRDSLAAACTLFKHPATGVDLAL
jgi:hypothetical protein